jgi:hypothetical protein
VATTPKASTKKLVIDLASRRKQSASDRVESDGYDGTGGDSRFVRGPIQRAEYPALSSTLALHSRDS